MKFAQDKKIIGTLRPSVIEEGLRAYEGVIWTCNVCGFQTRITFKDKRCFKCILD